MVFQYLLFFAAPRPCQMEPCDGSQRQFHSQVRNARQVADVRPVPVPRAGCSQLASVFSGSVSCNRSSRLPPPTRPQLAAPSDMQTVSAPTHRYPRPAQRVGYAWPDRDSDYSESRCKRSSRRCSACWVEPEFPEDFFFGCGRFRRPQAFLPFVVQVILLR